MKLQMELKSQKGKIKLRTEVALRQDQLLNERQSAQELSNKEIAELKIVVKTKDEELEELKVKLQTCQSELSETKKTIEENSNGKF